MTVDDLGIFTAAMVDPEQYIAEQELNAKPSIEAETAEAQAADRHIAAVRGGGDTVDARISQHAPPEPIRNSSRLPGSRTCRMRCSSVAEESGEYAKGGGGARRADLERHPERPAGQASPTQPAGAVTGQAAARGSNRCPNETVAPFFDKLFEVHSGLLRGTTPEYTPPVEIPEASNDTVLRSVPRAGQSRWNATSGSR